MAFNSLMHIVTLYNSLNIFIVNIFLPYNPSDAYLKKTVLDIHHIVYIVTWNL